MKINYLFFLILILAFVLRIINLGKYGLFVDEKFTILNANGICVGGYNQHELLNNQYFTTEDFWKPKSAEDFFQAVARSDFGTHIVYNFVLNGWMKVFGNSDFSVWCPVLMLDMALIILVYYMVRKMLDSTRTALFAAFLLAIEPLNISLSHFARSYTLSFLLLLASTYLFIAIVKYKTIDKRKILMVVAYGLLISLSLLNHYLNFLVPLSHIVVFLIFERNIKNWVLLSGAALFTGAVMLWWFTNGGGQWSMQFLKDKNALHLKMAQLPAGQNPMAGTVDPSTPKNVSMKTLPLFFDLSPVSNGVFSKIIGIKNLIITFFVFVLFITGIRYLKLKNYLISAALLAGIIALAWLYTGDRSGILLSLAFYYLIWLFVVWARKSFANQSVESRSLIIISVLMMFLPLGYIVLDAFKSGHTTSLSQRYIGFSIPFVAIIFAISLSELTNQSKWIQVCIFAILAFQGLILSKDIRNMLIDQSPKYNFVAKPRDPNPYKTVADKVLTLYAPGDTVLIPSKHETVYSEVAEKKKDHINKRNIDIKDAQNMNVYLPKGSRIIQRIDLEEADKFFIAHKDGSRTFLFDMKGTKYRY